MNYITEPRLTAGVVSEGDHREKWVGMATSLPTSRGRAQAAQATAAPAFTRAARNATTSDSSPEPVQNKTPGTGAIAFPHKLTQRAVLKIDLCK